MSADTVLPVAPSPVAGPARRSRLRRVEWSVVAVRLAVAVAILAAWQYAAGGPKSVLPALVVSHPTDVVPMMWHLLINGQLLSALGSTGLSVVYSMVIGGVVGVGLAIATSVPVGRWLLEPLVTVTYAIPKVGLIPLYIILLGLNTKAHVALVTSAVLFAFYYAMRQAIDDIDRDRLVTLRLMGAGYLKVVTALYLRSAMPQLLAALRIALPLAFATEIFAELQVPTTSGLGVLMEKFSQTGLDTLDPSGSIAVMLFVVLVAYVLDVVIGGRLRHHTEGIGVGAKR